MGSSEGFLPPRYQAFLFFLLSLQTRTNSGSFSLEAGQTFSTIGHRTQRSRVGLFGLGMLGFGLVSPTGCVVEGGPSLFDVVCQFGLASPDLARLSLQGVGIPAGGVDGRLGVAVSHALGRHRDRRGNTLLQSGQRVPAFLAAVEILRGFLQFRFCSLLCSQSGVGLGLCTFLRLSSRGLIGQVGSQSLPRSMEVVCQQAGFRVALLRLNDGCPASRLCLASEWFELALQLPDEILESFQIRPGAFQLADCFFLAFTVFEHPGSLFDESSAGLGSGLKDRVELALTDDHVHLPPDTGVAEQLRDVQQTGGNTVDGVLGATTSEHSAGDRHLRVLDGQCTVGVVDGQLYLGASQRSTPRGAREDDILHFSAA